MTSLAETGAPAFDRVLQFGPHSYPFLVRSGEQAWDELRDLLAGLDPTHVILPRDEGVPGELVKPVVDALGDLAPVIDLPLPAEETGKTWALPGDLGGRAIAASATRRSVIVALGGGLAGNVAGVLAYNFFRGTPLVHVPTTLLGVSDSTASRKQAVNSAHGKNHLGGFWTPSLVFAHLDFLRTLPEDEIRAAWCEGAKNAVCILPDQLEEFASRIRHNPAEYTTDDLLWFISFCLDAKQKVVIRDPDEKAYALCLEWGHTLGHVLELLSRGRLRHGQAIALGGLLAARIAYMLGIGSPAVEQVHEDLLSRIGVDTMIPAGLTEDAIMAGVLKDNKIGYRRPKGKHVDFVLLEDLGVVHRTPAEPLPAARPGRAWTLTRPDRDAATYITQVPDRVVRAAIQSRLT